ncbi:putative Resolvase, N-terminal [Klebsormidium nitens]|uniref:Putative Resolvase, N-terminal n=1 Tax=Klebsormidium nitens TaxID=105231 RepID=A0A1Y1IUC3_KLENI|nr:putative Resolvase, N-terminal [Klebsormidium nitens]|eukprot:GAQ92436.1 putative Resolvase, N-terminal [Klebsormidium nitens]
MWWFYLKEEKRTKRPVGVVGSCDTERVVQPQESEKTPELQDIPPGHEKYANVFEKHAERFDDAYDKIREETLCLAKRRRQYSIMLDASSSSFRRAKDHFGVSSSTPRRWANEGKIATKRTAGNHRVFSIPSLEEKETRACIAYCRVSSSKQRDDLQRQRRFLSDQLPRHESVSDVGSGINFERPGLLSILERVLQGRVSEVVVASKDRLCRVHKSGGAIKEAEVALAFPSRCRKIRAFPTGHQRLILRKMVGGCRKLYNETVAMIRDRRLPFANVEAFEEAERRRKTRLEDRKRKKAEDDGSEFEEVHYKGTSHPWMDKVYVKNFLVPEDSDFMKANPYLKEIPKETRQQAVEDAIEAYKAAFSNMAVGNISNFEVGFRKKKDPRWSIAVAFNAVSGSRFWPRKVKDFGELVVAEPRHLRKRYGRELKISKDQLGRYWMVIMNDKGPKATTEEAAKGVEELRESTRENQAGDKPVAAIDPGIRTRHTIYMTDGRLVEVENQDIQRIVRLCRHVDRCISALSKGELAVSKKHLKRNPKASVMALFDHYRPSKKVQGQHVVRLSGEDKNRIRQKMHQLKAKIESLKNEIDDQTVAYLLRECKTVLLPPFDMHSMSTRLHHKTARAMMQWRHGTFKTKLVERAPGRGVRVMIVSEAYTSKTCGACGWLHPSLGHKVFCTADWTAAAPVFKPLQGDGMLRNLSLSGTSLCGADARPGVDNIFCSNDFISKPLTQVQGSGNVTAQGKGRLCVVAKDQRVFCTDSIVQNPVWTKRGDLAIDLAMNESGGICALNPDGTIFCQPDLTSGKWVATNVAEKKNVNLATNIHGTKLCIFNSDKAPAYCHDNVFAGDKAGWYGLAAAGQRFGLEKV